MSKKKEKCEATELMEGEREDVKVRQDITRDYYSSRPKTFDTMLGGYTQVHHADIQESNQVIQSLFKQWSGKLGSSHCLELGCGVGRVTKHLLSRYFDHIDINDLLEEYTDQTRALFTDDDDETKIDRAFVCSIGDLQLDNVPRYDLIWAQWVLGYLNADDLVVLLRKLKKTLKKNGLIVIKDNCVANGNEPEFDPDDQYYVRTGEQFYDIAHRAGFTLVKDQRSKLKEIVRELLPIRIFVLAMKSLPVVVQNVTLSLSSVARDIYPLIRSIRPDWTDSNTRLVTFTEGITNAILGLFDSRTPDDDQQALVIKLFGAHTELFIDRPSELNSMITLAEHGVLTQRVLVQFNNGIIYQYAPGQPCSREQVREENIARLIATKLAHFHSVPVQHNEQPYLTSLLRQFLRLLDEHGHSSEEVSPLASDVDLIENEILPRLVPDARVAKDLVLCHNDLLVKNLLYDAKNDLISFIDFEYTHVNFALFDIANHFVEYAGVDNADFTLYPTRDEQRRWLTIYFHARGLGDQPIDEPLLRRVDQFAALAHLLWGLWALVQSHLSQLDFDYVRYAQLRLSSYQQRRSMLFEER